MGEHAKVQSKARASDVHEQEIRPITDGDISMADWEAASVDGGSHGPAVSLTFSDAIDAIGMGPFQTRLVIICGMGWVIDAVEVLVIAFVLEDIADTFDLDSVSKGLIGSASFFGMLMGAALWSIFADKRGRRKAFVLSLACVFVGGIASAFASSFAALCVFRMIVGFGVGGNLPVTTALVTEFLPTNDRAQMLCRVSGVFWGMGIIVASLLGLIITNALGPGNVEARWRWFLGAAAVPSVIVAVAYRVLPESPRFLSVMERHDEAVLVLEEVARLNGKLDVLGLDPWQPTGEGDGLQLRPGFVSDDATGSTDGVPPDSTTTDVDRVKSSNGDSQVAALAATLREGEHVGETRAGYKRGEEAKNAEAGDVRELFHTPIMRRVTLCLWIVWLFVNLSYYGVTFLLPRYYHDMSGGKQDFVFILTALVGVSFFPGAYLAMWLCSEDRLGRVGALKWTSFATAVFFLFMAISHGVTGLFIPVSILTLLCTAAPGTILYVVTPELYSTKYRAVGLGSSSVVTRLGGLVAPVLSEVLYDRADPVAPLIIFGFIMIVTAVFAGMIPIETAGRKLDDDSWDRRGEALEGSDSRVTDSSTPPGV